MTLKPRFFVFYAWQSDKPGSHCRHLIREALDAAATVINADDESPYAVVIDQDTQGVTGLCDIPATILEKIEATDAFVCDLTYVAKSESGSEADTPDFEPRLCSNPNVLFELGFAFSAIGCERLIPVMNERYGPVAKQIFDLAHRRHPVSYSYPCEGISRENVVLALSRELERIIRDMMIAHGARESKDDDDLARFVNIRDQFDDAVRNNEFYNLERMAGAIAITIAPPPGAPFEFESIHRQHFAPPSKSCTSGWNPETRGNSVLAPADRAVHPGSESTVRCGLAELTTEGIIRAADTYILDQRFHRLDADIVPSSATEATIIRSVQRYLKVLTNLEAPLPRYIGISILRIRGYYFVASNREGSRQPYGRDDMRLAPVVLRDRIDVDDEKAVAAMLMESMNYIWREFGFASGSAKYTNGVWSPGF